MFKKKILVTLSLATSLLAVPMPDNIKEKLEQLWSQHIENVSVQTYVLPYDEQHPQPEGRMDLTLEELEKLGSPVIYADLEHKINAGQPLTTPIDLYFIDRAALEIFKKIIHKIPLTINEQHPQILANALMAADIYKFDLELLIPTLHALPDNTICHLYTFFTQDSHPEISAILDEIIKIRLSYIPRTIETPKSVDFIKANRAGNRVVTANTFNSVQIFDLLNNENWQLTQSLPGVFASAVALSPNGNHFVIGIESDVPGDTLKVFNLVNGVWHFTQHLSGVTVNNVPMEHRGTATSVAFNADGTRLVSGSNRRDIIVWDLVNGYWQPTNSIEEVEAFFDEHYSIATNGAGNRIIRGSEDGTIKVWDFINDTWQLTHTLGEEPDNRSPIDAVVLSADGSRILSYSGDGELKIYDLVNNNWQLTHTINSQDADVNGDTFDNISLSTDGNLIFVGANNTTIKIWKLVNGTWQHKEDLGESGASSIAVSNNRIFSSDNDTTITIWDKESANDFCHRVAPELYAEEESLEGPASKRARTQ